MLKKLKPKNPKYDTTLAKKFPRFKISGEEKQLPRIVNTQDGREAGVIDGFMQGKNSPKEIHTYWPNPTSWDHLVDVFGEDEKAWAGKSIETVVINQMTQQGMADVIYVKGSYKQKDQGK